MSPARRTKKRVAALKSAKEARRVILNALVGIPSLAATYIISQIGLNLALPSVYNSLGLQFVLPSANLNAAIVVVVLLGLIFGGVYAVIERWMNLTIGFRNVFIYAVIFWGALFYLPLLALNLGSIIAIPIIAQALIDLVGLAAFAVLFLAMKEHLNV